MFQLPGQRQLFSVVGLPRSPIATSGPGFTQHALLEQLLQRQPGVRCLLLEASLVLHAHAEGRGSVTVSAAVGVACHAVILLGGNPVVRRDTPPLAVGSIHAHHYA